MRRFIVCVSIALIELCGLGIVRAQYSLQLIQSFPEKSAGMYNQAKFADVNGDGLKAAAR